MAPAVGLRTIFRDWEDVRPEACELPLLPMRDLVVDEAALHGWTGRRVVDHALAEPTRDFAAGRAHCVLKDYELLVGSWSYPNT